eukprot:scaffold1798_cov248-Pinguiococcus_pyrenoidosus.AAC.8
MHEVLAEPVNPAAVQRLVEGALIQELDLVVDHRDEGREELHRHGLGLDAQQAGAERAAPLLVQRLWMAIPLRGDVGNLQRGDGVLDPDRVGVRHDEVDAIAQQLVRKLQAPFDHPVGHVTLPHLLQPDAHLLIHARDAVVVQLEALLEDPDEVEQDLPVRDSAHEKDERAVDRPALDAV